MKDREEPDLPARVRSRWLLWAVVLLLAAYTLSRRWDPPQEQVQAARATASDPGRPAELVARGWVSTNEIQAGETLRFWVTFHNLSKEPVRNLRFLYFKTPGFERSGNCWRGGFPTCIGSGAGRALPQTLASGASVTVWGDLEPAEHSGRYGLSTVFAWANPAGGQLRKALLLGPVEVTTWWGEAVMRFARRSHAFVKDFALPIAVVLLTLWVGKFQTERERKRAAADQKQAQIRDTWRSLLPQFLEDTQKYYLPLNSKLSLLLTTMRETRIGGPREVRLRFYYLMSFMRQIKFLSERIGGVHFKSRSGEQLFGLSWGAFRQQVVRRLRTERIAQALAAMKAKEPLGQFEERFGDSADEATRSLFIELEGAFREWLEDSEDPFERSLAFLDALYLTTSFEVNRPFEFWYGSPPDFPREGLKKAKRELPGEPHAAVALLHEKLDDYLREGAAEEKRT